MTAAAIIAILAAIVAVAAASVACVALVRARREARSYEEEIERGKTHFAEVVRREGELQSAALAETLAVGRTEALAVLAAEQRKITEDRRREVAVAEREANEKLSAALAQAQRAVEQRLADWGVHLTGLQESLAVNMERIGQRQQRMRAEVEARIREETERFQASLDEHRGRLGVLRDDLEHAVQDLARSLSAELDMHASERRRELQGIAERLQRREQEVEAEFERRQADTSQRMATQIEEGERRQVEQLRRTVAREAEQTAVRAAQEFDTTIRAQREEAARRLSRQLDIAVDRFAREAEAVLSERIEAEVRAIDARMKELGQRLDALSTRA